MSAMKVLCSIWRLLDARQKRGLVAMQFVSVLMAVCTVGGMAAVLPFFTVLAEPHAIQAHPALRALYEHIHFVDENRFVAALGILFVMGVLISNIVNLIGSLAIDRFAFEVGDTLHTALFDEYLHRGYGFHSQTHSATLTSNVLYETGRVADGILRHGLILVTSLVSVFCIIVSILLLNPRVAIFAIVGLGASYIGLYAAARDKLRRNGEKESEYFAERTRIVGESFGAIKEIIVLQAQSVFVARLARCCRSISNTIVDNLAIAQSPKHILECVTVCVLVGVALYSHMHGESVGPMIAQLSFIGLAVYRLLPALQQMFLAIVRIRSDSPAFERIATDLSLARARKPVAERAAISPAWLGMPHRDIHLHAVSYTHSQGGLPAIANLNLRLRAGTAVGFIGANGSGKTTLIDLLSGLLVPESGSVEIDGVALDDVNRSAWQAAIAYVPQNIFLCDSTLAENVALGVDSAKIDRERLGAVVELARLRACVAGLPKGVDERVGERGARLSGGQRQRLGIARALYRDASLIIMDEATSALDAAAERHITDTIAEYRGRKTIVLVAHRLSALRHCDVIYELANGHIVRSGSFQQLQVQAAALGAGRSDVRHSDGESKESARGSVKPPIVGQTQSEKGFDEARRLAADGG